MSSYEKPILTDKGLDILTRKNIGDGKSGPFKFTKMAIGSGMLPPNQKPEELTELVEKIKDINIINFEITGLGLSDVTGEINNVGITQETPIFEIGVYAEDPETNLDVLYMYVYTRNSPAVLYQPVSTLYFGEFTIKTIISRDTQTVANVVKPEKAKNLGYDNSKSGMNANDVQGAIDELNTALTITSAAQVNMANEFTTKKLTVNGVISANSLVLTNAEGFDLVLMNGWEKTAKHISHNAAKLVILYISKGF